MSGDKNEILFTRFGINYSTLPEQFRRGSTVVRREVRESEPLDTPEPTTAADAANDDPRRAANPLFGHVQKRKPRPVPAYDGTKGEIVVVHVDMVKDEFWNQRPWLLR